MKFRVSIAVLLFTAMHLGIAGASAEDGVRGTLSRGVRGLAGAPGFTQGLAVADFDSDSEPDGAFLSETGSLNGQRLFRINLHLTSGPSTALTFSSAEPALDISAVDVNRDGSPDIVVEKALTHQRLQVFLNDGHGAFQRVANNDSFPAFDASAPLWLPWSAPQSPLILLLASTRGNEVVEIVSKAVPFRGGMEPCSLWSKVFVAQRGSRGPSSSRAPPSRLSL